MNIQVRSIFKRIVIIMTFLSIVSCCSVQHAKTSCDRKKLDEYLGWLHGNCLAIKNSNLLKGSDLIIVSFDNTQELIHSKIEGKTNSKDICYALLDDRKEINLNSGLNFYKISSKKPIELGIGIVQRNIDDVIAEKGFLDINGDGKKDSFSQCSTSEGIRFIVWDGIAYKSNIIWSSYYYLGYDIEANCPIIPEL